MVFEKKTQSYWFAKFDLINYDLLKKIQNQGKKREVGVNKFILNILSFLSLPPRGVDL